MQNFQDNFCWTWMKWPNFGEQEILDFAPYLHVYAGDPGFHRV